MELEQQVTSLELSKKLKELGVPQESLAYFIKNECIDKDYNCRNDDDYFDLHIFDSWEPMSKSLTMSKTEFYSAFTVAELGEMLPDWSSGAKGGGKWGYNFICGGKFSQLDDDIEENTEADARAKTLIYLFENKLIKL